ncbi:hypothetical protein [Limosilactobacillus mucosae]|uniref:hypothetical protein n=1 Tax=Limosilactobacillus mucosae TaxID=97478 RepID=UPI0022DFF046|nr:hypothetical protein [Limosilactobacillus mucosae]
MTQRISSEKWAKMADYIDQNMDGYDLIERHGYCLGVKLPDVAAWLEFTEAKGTIAIDIMNHPETPMDGQILEYSYGYSLDAIPTILDVANRYLVECGGFEQAVYLKNHGKRFADYYDDKIRKLIPSRGGANRTYVYVVYEIYYDEQGDTTKVANYGFMHKADAERYLQKLQADQQEGHFAYLRAQKLFLNGKVDRKNATNIWVAPEELCTKAYNYAPQVPIAFSQFKRATDKETMQFIQNVQQIVLDPDSIKGNVS